eukprot:GILK01006982.1.p1 GENE.GILK01006982.1~~GILK01006982.1.p1  ORF type:complete len:375 (+),score=77.77 GILK01006982.1:361-1485(+)
MPRDRMDKFAALFGKKIHSCLFCPRVDKYPTQWQDLMYRIHVLLEDPYSGFWAAACAGVMLLAIVGSTLLFILRTVRDIRLKIGNEFDWIEVAATTIFALDYIIRLSVASNRWRFLIHPLNIIDFLCILPIFLELAVYGDIHHSDIKRLRELRLIRLLKLARYLNSVKLIGRTLRRSFDALMMVGAFLLLSLVCFSTFMYYAERGVWNNERQLFVRTDGLPSPFQSIPESFWWAVVTITTLGYGDAYPVSAEGKFIAGIAAIVGIMFVALPVSILTTNFSDVWKKDKRVKQMRKAISMAQQEGLVGQLGQETQHIIYITAELDKRFSNLLNILYELKDTEVATTAEAIEALQQQVIMNLDQIVISVERKKKKVL